MHGDAASAEQMDRAGGMREAGQLRQHVAVLRGVIAASSLRRSSESDTAPFQLEQPSLVVRPSDP